MYRVSGKYQLCSGQDLPIVVLLMDAKVGI